MSCARADSTGASRRRSWRAGCGLRAALAWALVLTLLATSAALADARETPAVPAKLPVQIIEKPVSRPAAFAASPASSSLPLPPLKQAADAGGRARTPTPGAAITTVITSLAVVLGLFVLSALILRKAHARHGATLPGEVVQTLGRAPLSGRQEMHLVRVGNKLLLLSVTATGAETLTEITEPGEIDRLAGICRQSHPDSITASFREILWQCGQTQRA